MTRLVCKVAHLNIDNQMYIYIYIYINRNRTYTVSMAIMSSQYLTELNVLKVRVHMAKIHQILTIMK